MSETFLPVLGFEGRYQISNLGTLRSVKQLGSKLSGRVLRWNICGGGYGAVSLFNQDGSSVRRYIHRLVAESFIGPRPLGYDINHINGVKTDCRVENLEYMTKSENQRHASDVLGKRCGASGGTAKLTNEDVRFIRANAHTMSQRAMGDRFGVNQANISQIVLRKTWTKV